MFIVLLILIVYIPFQIALNPLPDIDLASVRVLIPGIFIFFFLFSKKTSFKGFFLKLISGWQAKIILFFFVLSVLSLVQADNIGWGVRKILVFASVFPLYFLFASELKNNTDIKTRKIVNVIVWSGFFAALIGLVQFSAQFFIGIESLFNFWAKNVAPVFQGRAFAAEIIKYPSWLVNISGKDFFRAFSLFPDPHTFTFYIGLIFPLAVMLLARDYKRKLFWLLVIVLWLAALFSFSRSAYLGMIFSLGAMFFLGRKILFFRGKIIITVLMFATLAVFILPQNPISARFFDSFKIDEGSNTERLENWSQGLKIIKENLFFGVGIGNYPRSYIRQPVYSHNLYLDIWAEMGIFALIVWLTLISGAIWKLCKSGLTHISTQINIDKNTDARRYISLGLAGSLAWFSVQSFFDTPIYSPQVLSALMVVLVLSTIICRDFKN